MSFQRKPLQHKIRVNVYSLTHPFSKQHIRHWSLQQQLLPLQAANAPSASSLQQVYIACSVVSNSTKRLFHNTRLPYACFEAYGTKESIFVQTERV